MRSWYIRFWSAPVVSFFPSSNARYAAATNQSNKQTNEQTTDRPTNQVVLESDEKAWCTLTAQADNKVLGKSLGKELAVVKKALLKLDSAALWPLLEVRPRYVTYIYIYTSIIWDTPFPGVCVRDCVCVGVCMFVFMCPCRDSYACFAEVLRRWCVCTQLEHVRIVPIFFFLFSFENDCFVFLREKVYSYFYPSIWFIYIEGEVPVKRRKRKSNMCTPSDWDQHTS